MQSFKDLWRGIRRHPFKAIVHAFTAFSILLTISRGVDQFFPGVSIDGWYAFGVTIFVSVCYGLKKVWKPSRIAIQVANSDTKIEVLFGDLFAQDGVRVIAVNEFFDSKIGKPVSEKSLHGTFVNRCFGGHPQAFDDQVGRELLNVQHEVVEREEGHTRKYAIGTTAMLTADSARYLVFALTQTDISTYMASADVTMMWSAMHKMWARAQIECGGEALNVPLVGSGLSKIGLPTRDLLNLIILSAITETKKKVITKRIRIVLHRDRFEDLDLRDVKAHWTE